jgi:hypothetical protein
MAPQTQVFCVLFWLNVRLKFEANGGFTRRVAARQLPAVYPPNGGPLLSGRCHKRFYKNGDSGVYCAFLGRRLGGPRLAGL